MLTRRQALGASAFGLLAAGGTVPGARAQAIDKVVHVIVGFPAGGGTDITARVLAEALQGTYAKTLIVEDKPGASARLAVEYVKNAPPDGSVMLFTPDFPMTLYPWSFKSLNYDPAKDFIAAAAASKSMLTFVVGPAVPNEVTTLAAFVQWCKANPAQANFATTSAGGTPHFTGVMLAREAGVALTPVHYRGGAPDGRPGRRPHPGERQSGQRGDRNGQGRIDPHPGRDRRRALGVFADCADHEGGRIQRGG
jgi:tripartite-type tricarboxylate transporter receptor subunit TctC